MFRETGLISGSISVKVVGRIGTRSSPVTRASSHLSALVVVKRFFRLAMSSELGFQVSSDVNQILSQQVFKFRRSSDRKIRGYAFDTERLPLFQDREYHWTLSAGIA
jgi:hypothetical protein